MAGIETAQQVTLKLMVSKERNKVFFAEAGKDFVDILFSFLALPLGTITRLVSEKSNLQPIEVGSLSSLYKSVENLDKKCLRTDTCKEMLLQSGKSLEPYGENLKLNIFDTQHTEYFVCNNLVNCRHQSPVLFSTSRNEICRCGYMMAKPISPESGSSVFFDGFVKSNATFMITDDLKVLPCSLDTINLLKDYGIENVSLVNEMTVTITKNQVIDLLKCCLLSNTTLTDSFLEKEPCFERFNKINLLPCDINANGSGKINVKIMQRKSNGKIVFAQGKEDFADFLFSFLTFPSGAVAHLMEGRSSMGRIDGLYKSIVDLDEDYWTTNEVKNQLVNPGLAPQFKLSNQLLPIYDAPNPEYFCNTKHTSYSVYSYEDEFNMKVELTACYLPSTFKQVDRSMGTCTAMKFVSGKKKRICERTNNVHGNR